MNPLTNPSPMLTISRYSVHAFKGLADGPRLRLWNYSSPRLPSGLLLLEVWMLQAGLRSGVARKVFKNVI